MIARSNFIANHALLEEITFSTNFEQKDTFTSYKIVRQLNCKRSQLFYLLQCRICQLQCVNKSETYFNIRLNNHRKDSKNKKQILA